VENRGIERRPSAILSGRQGRGFRRWLAVATIALVSTTADARPVDIAALGAEMDARLEGFRERDGFPGAMAAFALPDGRVGHSAVGWADPKRRIPMTPDLRSMSGSVGKTFVAALALSLAQEEKLDLDSRIETWLGEEPWFSRLPNARELTLRMLLQHAGGLEDHVALVRFYAKAVWRLLTRGPDAYVSPLEEIQLLLGRDPLFPAGAGYHYTDTGYLLVGLILEKVAGRPYYELIRERFLEPLALTRTMPSDRRDIPDLIAGHQEQLWFLPRRVVDADGNLRFSPAAEWTGGGLATNPHDLVRWAKALYEEKALPGQYLDELLANPSDAGEGFGYGLGVFIYRATPVGPAYGHGGYFPGYRTQMLYFPDHQVAVAVQLNVDDGVEPREYAFAIAEGVVEALRTAREK
jgi:D-alanyl-D-alanine carboxypeptidase